MSQFHRTEVHVEFDREQLIEAYLRFVRQPSSQERQAAIKGGPVPPDLLEMLSLEGGTSGAAVTRVVKMLDHATSMVRLDLAA